jgi:dienelactone hydrolase
MFALLALTNGLLAVLSRVVNASLSDHVGSRRGSLVNHAVGLVVVAGLILAGVGNGTVRVTGVAPADPCGDVLGVLVVAASNYAVRTHRVDATRIHPTGLSLGGHGTWAYAPPPDRLSAAAPVCGDGRRIGTRHDTAYCALAGLPLWAFHGVDDPVVDPDGSVVPVRRLRACVPPPAPAPRLTIFPGVGPDSWSRVYDGSGRQAPQADAWTPFDQSLYDWLLQYER